MLSPRLLVSEVPDTINQLDQSQLINPDLKPAFTAQALAGQQLGRSYETVVQGNKENAQLMSRAFNNTADYAQAYAVAKESKQQYDGSGFNNLLASLGEVGNAYLRIKEAERKAKEEAEAKAKKERQDRAWIAANEEAEVLVTGSEGILRGEGGYQQYKDRSNEVLKKYMPDLEAAQVVEILRRMEDPAQRVSQAEAAERREVFNKQVNAAENAEVKKGLASLSLIGTFLKKAKNPEEIQSTTERYMAEIQRVLPTLQPLSQSVFLADAYEDLATYVDLAQGQYIDLKNQLEGLGAYTQEATTEFNNLKKQGPSYLPQYRAKVEYLKQKYSVKGTTFADDPYESEKVEEDFRDRQKKIDAAVESGSIDAIEKANVTYDETIALAYTFYSNPSQIEAYGKYTKNPKIKAAIELSKQIKQYDDKVFEIRQKRDRIQTELRAMDVSDQKQWLSWVSSDQGQQLLEQTGIRARLNNRLKDILAGQIVKKDGSITSLSQAITGKDPNKLDLMNLGTASLDDQLTNSSEVKPEEIQRVRQQIQALQGVVKQDLVKQSQLLEQDPDYVRLSGILAAYKIRDPKQRAAQAKVAAGRVGNMMTRIQASEQSNVRRVTQPQMNRGGTQQEIPFKLPQLKTIKVGQAQAILPFRPDVQTPFSGDYGEWRGTRNHAGLDIAVPSGTPVVFYDHGEVIKVARQEGKGYGNYMDIRTRDGRVHRFAHAQGFLKRVGQKVEPGMVIGKSGDSGSPGAHHLHWEVRRKGGAEYGYEGTEDPLKYSTSLRNGWGTQVANGQRQPTKVPPDSARLSNGDFVQNGSVVRRTGMVVPAAYSRSNPIRNEYASTNLKDYRRANSVSANYGYAALARNPGMARELARTASHIGVPAMWLADVIGYESGFDTTAVNQGGSGATGLIQFMEETAKNLGTSTAAISKMDYKQQFALIRKYFDKSGFSKKMTNPYAVLSAIWAGHIDRANRYDQSFLGVGDGDITFKEYSRKLGSKAGRKYMPFEKKGTPIHTSFRPGCAMCSSLARSNSSIIPHESTV